MSFVRSVLVVDDNEPDLYIAVRILKRSGRYEHVYTACDGSEALDMFRRYHEEAQAHPERFPPLMMLLDINMPNLGGFEFLDDLQKLDLPTMPTVVIMLTSSGANEDSDRASQYEAVEDFVTKPLTTERAMQLADKFGK